MSINCSMYICIMYICIYVCVIITVSLHSVTETVVDMLKPDDMLFEVC